VPSDSKHTHRLLALVPPSGIQQVSDKQQDKVYTWPHLLLVEFVALLAMGAVLLVMSYFIDATFRDLANPNLTPNPSKAPWYFLGLQELLRYFHPMVAGVTIPGVGLIVLGGAAYVDKNPSAKPENRKFATMAMTFFLVMWTVFVFAGSFFRGPGFNWVWPWVDGLFFEL
jgi:quinol-cytochrome oxidoreductase complex cytochrome b subunit